MPTAAAKSSHDQLHVVHIVLSLDVGGLERNVVNQVREGQRLGQKVSVLCLDAPGVLSPRVEAMGATVISLNRSPGLRPEFIIRIRQALHRLEPDVVHTHQLATLLYAGAAAKTMRVPVVIHTEHGQEPYASRRRTRLLGRLAGQFCDRFYCLTNDMAGEVRKARIVPNAKLRVIPNGIDVQDFTKRCTDGNDVRRSLSIPANAPLIGTVGRLNEVKRQDVLLRAFAKLLQHCPTAHLLLVGDGPLREDLQALATNLGIERHVHFAGYQPHSAPYLQVMNVFALTSRSEGMPQAVLEACVSGLPVVVTRVGGLPELITHGVNGFLCTPDDDNQLACLLCELIQQPATARRAGEAARARVEAEFSVARMARDYHRDITDLLRSRGWVDDERSMLIHAEA